MASSIRAAVLSVAKSYIDIQDNKFARDSIVISDVRLMAKEFLKMYEDKPDLNKISRPPEFELRSMALSLAVEASEGIASQEQVENILFAASKFKDFLINDTDTR